VRHGQHLYRDLRRQEIEAENLLSEINMPRKKSNNALTSANVMQRARDACADLKPLTDPMTEEELQQRAEMIDKVIRARRKLQLLRDRTQALKDALGRFKTQRDAIRA
jgi:hypothetical protein